MYFCTIPCGFSTVYFGCGKFRQNHPKWGRARPKFLVFLAVILFGCSYIPQQKQKKPTKMYSKCIFAPFHVVFPLYILGVGYFAKNTQNGGGQGQNSWFFQQLYCLVAPIFHIKSRKNQPKCILNGPSHVVQFCYMLAFNTQFFNCILGVFNYAKYWEGLGENSLQSIHNVWLLLYFKSNALKTNQKVF